MSRAELVQGLGTIAHSGTKAFMDRIEAAQAGEGASLIGQFGVGFYSAFMVADRVDVFSRRAGAEEAWQWSSDGKGTFSVAPVPLESAPHRGTRVVVHLAEEAKDYLERFRLERMVRAQSGHVPVPIAVVEKPGEKPFELVDGAALWAKPKSEISTADYTAAVSCPRLDCSQPLVGDLVRVKVNLPWSATTLIIQSLLPPSFAITADSAGTIEQ